VVSDGRNSSSLLALLKPHWREWSDSAESRRSGIVKSLFPHGRAGFIIADDKQQFFFDARDWKENGGSPEQGYRVTFRIKPSFDRKRQQPSIVACDIRRG